MIILGIDPSINCTGICIYDTATNAHIYYMIAAKCTKKMKEFSNDYVHIIDYGKLTFKSNNTCPQSTRRTG